MGLTDTEQREPAPEQRVWNGRDVLWMSMAAAGVTVAGVLVLTLLRGGPADGVEPGGTSAVLFSVALLSLEAVALVGAVYLFGILRKRYDWTAVGLRPTPWYWLLAAATISLIFIPIRSVIALLVQLLIGTSAPDVTQVMDLLVPEGITVWSALGLALLVGLIVPIAEEIFFRGVLYRWMRGRWGIWPAIIASAIVFGAIHGNVVLGVSNFVLGIVLALIYEYSRSLWTAITVHAVNNTVAELLLFLFIVLQQSSATLTTV